MSASQLYGGCEADSNLCMANDFLASDQAGGSPFLDPAGRNPIYQGDPPVYTESAESAAVVSTYSGTMCDPMPQWKVTWNPPEYPECMDQQIDARGLMPPAAWARHPTEELALPAQFAAESEGVKAKETKPSRPSPGHLVLCGHAAIMGAALATSQAFEDLRNGHGAEALGKWTDNFESKTKEAAGTVTPVGAFFLREVVFTEKIRA